MTPADSQQLRWSRRLSLVIAMLAAIAAAVGLFIPAVYRETAWVVPHNRGQDLVTLLALAALVPAVRLAGRGSARAKAVCLGLLGYLAYTYTGAAVAYHFNELFPVYVALFSLMSMSKNLDGPGTSGDDRLLGTGWHRARFNPDAGLAGSACAGLAMCVAFFWHCQE